MWSMRMTAWHSSSSAARRRRGETKRRGSVARPRGGGGGGGVLRLLREVHQTLRAVVAQGGGAFVGERAELFEDVGRDVAG